MRDPMKLKSLNDRVIRKGFCFTLPYVRLAVCALIFFGVVALLVAMASHVGSIYAAFFIGEHRKLLHDIAVLLVMLKAVRILVAYLATHHVRLQHIVEIAIIAPAIELVFAPDRHSFEMDVLFAVFATVNLFIMVKFYDVLSRMNIDTENGREIKGFRPKNK